MSDMLPTKLSGLAHADHTHICSAHARACVRACVCVCDETRCNGIPNFNLSPVLYAPNFEKVGSILVSACPCVHPSVRSKKNSS